MAASMRPRHKAAENLRAFHDGADAERASMRPRHKAAENILLAVLPADIREAASMRPRHKAAENRTVNQRALAR